MKLTNTALRRPVTVLIALIALIFFGVVSISKMGMERFPDIDFPMIAVSTSMTGASPTVMDNDVTDVIEEQLNTISGIENISSSSYEGSSVILVEFELGRDIDAAAADVRDKVNLATRSLPDEADAPIVQKFTIGDRPVVTIAVIGEAPYEVRSNFADKVAKLKLQTVENVGNVSTAGLQEREIRIWLDPAKLEARGLLVKDVKDAISQKHIELPAGRVETEKTELTLRLEGEYSSVEELKTLPVTSSDGAVIRLGDIARVEDGYEDQRTMATYNGEPVILLQVRKQRGANEVLLGNAVVEVVEELKKITPRGVELRVLSNSATFVKDSMKGVGKDIIMGVMLCSLVMLLFLRTIRATFVTVVTIPACLLGSLIVLRFAGVTINNMSMLGLSLAVGLVVDATTVVLENVHRHQELGEKPFNAASIGTSEVGFAVLAGAATTVAVFGPVATMEGIIGRFFFAFGITVVTTILISLSLSLTLTPFLCSKLLQHDRPGKIGRAIERAFQSLEMGYSRALNFAVHHRIILVAVAIAIFSLGMFLASQLGTGFFPTEDSGDFSIDVELPLGVSVNESNRILQQIGELVREEPEVDYTYASIGAGRGGEVNKGEINVYLIPRNERVSMFEIMKRMRRKLSIFRDVEINLGTHGGAGATLTLVGSDTESLVAVAEKMKADLEKNPGLADIQTDIRLTKPRVNISINRALADDMNVNIKSLSEEMQAYFGGVKAGVFKDQGYRYDIRLMAEKDLRTKPSDIDNIPVRNGNGEIVRVPGIIEVSQGSGPNLIKRYNRQRSLTISANTVDISMGEAMGLVRQSFMKYKPADGSVNALVTGRSKHMAKNFQYLINAIITAIILVYMVMAVQFESFLHPLTVMFSLPMMTAGVFGMLLLTGKEIDVMSLMGIILLVGIVVNNAILLVDFTNQQRDKGVDKVTAVLRAGPMRLRPILMTAISTMVGALPIALGLSEGAEVRQPMSIAVIGGLFTSTILTLLIIPTAYLIVDDSAEKVAQWWKRLRGQPVVMEDEKEVSRERALEPEMEFSGGK
ncbi:MAG: efflux RND transporter permease subunit [Synergistales bacterium]|nr:efflux RND transporter permease subunit [Synergistales bacterium]